MKIVKVLIEERDAVWYELCAVPHKVVSKYMGVTAMLVSHWKNGTRQMKWDQYVKLCKYLGVPHGKAD